MKYIDITFPTPAENLATDEALLNACEDGFAEEVLRFWAPQEYFVVLGSTNRIAHEVDVDACRSLGVPILRRSSGGGAVLQGPGCLCYALILRIHATPELDGIVASNRHIMNRQRELLQPFLEQQIDVKGSTDLTVGGRKFSGNAQRRKQRFLLFHGTFLLDVDISMIEKTLHVPAKQPAYRRQRTHRDFLVNVPLAVDRVKEAMRTGWGAAGEWGPIPHHAVQELMKRKYESLEWILRM